VNDVKPLGRYSISWEVSDIASGVYFIKMVTANFTKSEKVTLLK